MIISVNKTHLIVKFPLWQHKNNLYDEESEKELTHKLIGIIAGDEYTISQLNDLSYKDSKKEGMPIIRFDNRKELINACKIGGINIWEHPLCATCQKAIRGSFTINKKGNQCFDCEN